MSSDKQDFQISEIANARCNVIDVMNVAMPLTMPVPLVFDVEVSWAEKLRERYLERGHKISFTAILLKSISIAQREHPFTRTHGLPFNKQMTVERITAGFTVERMVKNEPTVFFGTVRDSDSKSILQIAKELCAYAKDPMHSVPQLALQLKSLEYPSWLRKLMMHLCIWSPAIREKLIPATFGISSVGKWGCKTGTPPALCTTSFGVGEIEERPIAVNGRLVIKPMVTITYVFDHKIIDGGPACRFMKDVVDLLQGGLETYVCEELESLHEPKVLRAA